MCLNLGLSARGRGPPRAGCCPERRARPRLGQRHPDPDCAAPGLLRAPRREAPPAWSPSLAPPGQPVTRGAEPAGQIVYAIPDSIAPVYLDPQEGDAGLRPVLVYRSRP